MHISCLIYNKQITIQVNPHEGMFLYSVVSSPLDRSKRFTLRPLAHLFIPGQTWLLWEAF